MTEAIAWFGMYDHAGQRHANDAIWAAIASRLASRGLADIPRELARDLSPSAAWSHPGLLLGQICTRPLIEQHRDLQIIAHPVYHGTPTAGRHSALVVVARNSSLVSLDDLGGARVAINDRGSNTGYALLGGITGPIEQWASQVIETGSHHDSLAAIVSGAADIASIDEITLDAIADYEPALAAGVRILARTREAPTPPFVTGAASPAATLRHLHEALQETFADPGLAEARASLRLRSLLLPEGAQ